MATLHYLDAADDPRLIDYRDLTDMDLRLRTEVANGGFMAEVAAQISEGPALFSLTEPIRRLCGMDVPIPYAPQLEKSVVPQLDDIIANALEVHRGS